MPPDDAQMKDNEKGQHMPKKAAGPIRYAYIALGLIFLGIAAAGVVLPLVPTTPFGLLAAMCFGKSSHRLHNWFVSTRFYSNNIEGFVKQRAMTIKAKLTLLATITVFMGISFFVMHITAAPIVPQVVLAIIWSLHVLYFGFKVKTVKQVK